MTGLRRASVKLGTFLFITAVITRWVMAAAAPNRIYIVILPVLILLLFLSYVYVARHAPSQLLLLQLYD